MERCYVCGGEDFDVLPVKKKIIAEKYAVIFIGPERPVCKCCGDYLSSAEECKLQEAIEELLKGSIK